MLQYAGKLKLDVQAVWADLMEAFRKKLQEMLPSKALVHDGRLLSDAALRNTLTASPMGS